MKRNTGDHVVGCLCVRVCVHLEETWSAVNSANERPTGWVAATWSDRQWLIEWSDVVEREKGAHSEWETWTQIGGFLLTFPKFEMMPFNFVSKRREHLKAAPLFVLVFPELR